MGPTPRGTCEKFSHYFLEYMKVKKFAKITVLFSITCIVTCLQLVSTVSKGKQEWREFTLSEM